MKTERDKKFEEFYNLFKENTDNRFYFFGYAMRELQNRCTDGEIEAFLQAFEKFNKRGLDSYLRVDTLP